MRTSECSAQGEVCTVYAIERDASHGMDCFRIGISLELDYSHEAPPTEVCGDHMLSLATAEPSQLLNPCLRLHAEHGKGRRPKALTESLTDDSNNRKNDMLYIEDRELVVD